MMVMVVVMVTVGGDAEITNNTVIYQGEIEDESALRSERCMPAALLGGQPAAPVIPRCQPAPITPWGDAAVAFAARRWRP